MGKTIGCIGCGNMGSALLTGFAKALDRQQWQIVAYDKHNDKCEPLVQAGIKIMPDAQALAKAADIIIYAVKPDALSEVIEITQKEFNNTKAAISIAAGTGLARLRTQLGPACKIARCMPTITAKSNHGIFAVCFDPLSQEPAFQKTILELFGKIGVCYNLAEDQFTAFSAFIGAGPAYIFQVMQGLAQAGLTMGFTQAQNREMLVELVAGCASLAAQEKEKNFTQLRDDVCSPAGLTIAGINVLERAGINGILTDAVETARNRAKIMEN